MLCECLIVFDANRDEDIPQGLKPSIHACAHYGTTEVVPFQNRISFSFETAFGAFSIQRFVPFTTGFVQPALERASSRDQVEDQHNHRNDQQDVDQAAGDVQAKSEQPQH
jgi:hypothetical protein